MCELCLDSREGNAYRRPSVPAARASLKRTKAPKFGPRGEGRGSLQEDQAPHSGPRGGGEREAKPSRLRLAEPAHACALAVRTSHFIIFILIFLHERFIAIQPGVVSSHFVGHCAKASYPVFRRHGFKPIGLRRGSKTLGAAEIRRETRTLEESSASPMASQQKVWHALVTQNASKRSHGCYTCLLSPPPRS